MCHGNVIKKVVTGLTGCIKTQYSDGPSCSIAAENWRQSVLRRVCCVFRTSFNDAISRSDHGHHFNQSRPTSLNNVGYFQSPLFLWIDRLYYNQGCGRRQKILSKPDLSNCNSYLHVSAQYVYCITPLIFLILIMDTLQGDSGGHVTILEVILSVIVRKKLIWSCV
jgi:hypothetical protein